MEPSELLDLTNPINLTTPLPEDLIQLPMHAGIPYSEIGTPCCFLTGQAGTGKSYTLQRHMEAFPNFAAFTCSTGVAAINLSDNAVTINSKLGFFNLETLQQNFNDGYLEDRIRRIKLQEQVLWLVMDEVSMSMGRALDIIYTALDNVNSETPDKPPLGFMLTGDPCFDPATMITMADGSILPIAFVNVGDYVMGDDFKPKMILRTSTGLAPMYLVQQTNGDPYIVNGLHTLVLKRSTQGHNEKTWTRYPDLGDITELTVHDYLSKSGKFKDVFVGFKAGRIPFPMQPVQLDPYFLGLWLGDGDSDAPRITSMDKEVINFCCSYANSLGLSVSTQRYDRTEAVRLYLSKGYKSNKPNPIIEALRFYGIWKAKRIPKIYLQNSEHIRLQLLAGLIDSDGCYSANRYSIACLGLELAEDIKLLADQLGFRTSLRWHSKCWVVYISGDVWQIPCKIARKICHFNGLDKRDKSSSQLKIELLKVGKYVGIQIEGNGRFLLADGTVVHNCQLAPVPEDKVINGKLVISPKTHRAEKMPIDWPYNAKCWPKFAANTIHLTKVHRQSDPTFLSALNHLRSGNGTAAASLLKMAGVRFFDSPEEAALEGETGTIIVGTNKMVDKINLEMLEKEEGESFTVESKRWFARQKPPKEWEHVPDFMELKIGSLVMVLTNDAPVFSYVNGDLGRVTGVLRPLINDPEVVDEGKLGKAILVDALANPSDWHEIVGIEVELLRNGNRVIIPKITRTIWQVGAPDDWELTKHKDKVKEGRVKGVRRKVWILGELTHFPIRLAYASTVNKTQGLTLPKIQIRLNDWFIGSPQFLYVAVSRCTTAEGIQIIGTPNKFAKMVKVHDQVRRFI